MPLINTINSPRPKYASIIVEDLTANRLVATDSSKTLCSVSNLASWIAGTSNQVTVTNDGDGTITLSLPQNIHTGASPTFAGAHLSAMEFDSGGISSPASFTINSDIALSIAGGSSGLTLSGSGHSVGITGSPISLTSGNGFNISLLPGSGGSAVIGALSGLLKGTSGVVSAITATTSADYLGGDFAVHTLNQAAVAGLTTGSSPTFANITDSGLIPDPAYQRIVISSTAGLLTNFPTLLYDSTNNRMIINENAYAAAPSLAYTALSIRGLDNNPVRIDLASYGAAGIGAYASRRSNGTAETPTACVDGNIIFGIEGWGYEANQWSVAPSAFIRGYAAGTWTNTSAPSYISFSTTPAASVTPAQQWSILSTGALVSGLTGVGTQAILTAGTLGAGATTITGLIDTGNGEVDGTLGVGTAPVVNGIISAVKSIDNTLPYGVYGGITCTSPSAPSGIWGLYFLSNWTPATLSSIGATVTCLKLNGTGAGISATMPASSAKNMAITESNAFVPISVIFNKGDNASKTMTVAAFSNYKTLNPTVSNGATITTLYGFYDVGMTVGGTNWGYYGLTKSYISNAVGTGAATLELAQLDTDEPIIKFTGTSAADQTKSISTVNGDGAVTGPKNFSASAGWEFVGMIRIDVNGADFWTPYYQPDIS